MIRWVRLYIQFTFERRRKFVYMFQLNKDADTPESSIAWN